MTPIVHDVSAAQNPASIDWGRARDEGGCVGAFVRVEYGKSIDAAWHAHAQRILSAGLGLGVYTYELPGVDPDDAVEQLVRELDDYVLDYGTFVDAETANHQAPGVVVSCALAICTGVDMARADRGEPATGIYTGAGFWSSLGDVGKTDEVKARRLWVANYGVSSPAVPAPWGKWKQPGGPVLWQAFGNTIWKDRASGEQRWGKVQPGPSWVKIASAFPTPYSAGELDTSLLPGSDDSPLRANT